MREDGLHRLQACGWRAELERMPACAGEGEPNSGGDGYIRYI